MAFIFNRKIGSQNAASHETSDYTFSFGNLCKCMCCPKASPGTDHIKMDAIIDKLEQIERSIHGLDTEKTECMSIEEEVPTLDGDPFSKNSKDCQSERLTPTKEPEANEFLDKIEMDSNVKNRFPSLESKTNGQYVLQLFGLVWFGFMVYQPL